MNVLSKLEKGIEEEVILKTTALSLMDLPNELIQHILTGKIKLYHCLALFHTSNQGDAIICNRICMTAQEGYI